MCANQGIYVCVCVLIIAGTEIRAAKSLDITIKGSTMLRHEIEGLVYRYVKVV